jgi:hypothetical protein
MEWEGYLNSAHVFRVLRFYYTECLHVCDLSCLHTEICCAKNCTSKLALITWRPNVVSNSCFISDSKQQVMLNVQVSVYIALIFITSTNIRWLDEDNIHLLGNSSWLLRLSPFQLFQSCLFWFANNMLIF